MDTIIATGTQTVEATWSNADLKANTALPLVAAQGANTIIVPQYFIARLNYGGNNAFTGTPTTQLRYGGSVSSVTQTFGAAFWNATATTLFGWTNPLNIVGTTFNMVNVAVDLNLSAAITGNAANDNTVTILFGYDVITL